MANLNLFVNAVFADKEGNPEFVACRLRGQDAKSVKIPADAFSELPSLHDGVSIATGNVVSESEKYLTLPDAKVLEVVAGAGKPVSTEHDADDYFAGLAESTDSDDEAY